MNAEVLCCRCGVAGRVVRLNDRTLAIGHVHRPKGNPHPFRLARGSAERLPLGGEDSQPILKGPATSPGEVPETDPSAKGRSPRGARLEARSRTAFPSGTPDPARRAARRDEDAPRLRLRAALRGVPGSTPAAGERR